MIWHALVVSPQTEFRVQSALITRGLRTIVPRQKLRAIKAGRRISVRTITLMPGYVFAGFTSPPDWPSLHVVDGLRGFVHKAGDPDAPAALRPHDLAALRAMTAPTVDDPPQRKRRIGDHITIRRGQYAKLAAIVDGLGRDRVTLLVEMFGRVNRVTVPAQDIDDAA